MKPDYLKQVKRVQKSIAILKLGDEIIKREKKKRKKRKRRTKSVSQTRGVSNLPAPFDLKKV